MEVESSSKKFSSAYKAGRRPIDFDLVFWARRSLWLCNGKLLPREFVGLRWCDIGDEAAEAAAALQFILVSY